jgi:hypothetical protein
MNLSTFPEGPLKIGLLILAFVCGLTGCGTSKPSKSKASSEGITGAEIASAGVTPAELSDLQEFYRALRDGEGKRGYRVDPSMSKEDTDLLRLALSAFGRPSAPKRIILMGEGGIKLGLVFDPIYGRLGFIDPVALSGHQMVRFERVNRDYRLTLVEGCMLFPVKVKNRGGRPLMLSWSIPDRG